MRSTLSILIIEDDATKLESISTALIGQSDISRDDIVSTGCIKGARHHLKESSFDLLILDLNVPLDANGTPVQSAGHSLLVQVYQSARYNRPRHVIFVSRYVEQIRKLQLDAIGRSWHSIQYRSDSDAWRNELLEKVEYIASSEQQRKTSEFGADCAFITALDKPELEAFEQMGKWRDVSSTHSRVLETHIPAAQGKDLHFVATAAPQMGCTASAISTSQIIAQFRPRLVIMSGIAAGFKSEVSIGDILAAEASWEWQSGKFLQSGKRAKFLHAPSPIRASPELITKVRNRNLVRRLVSSLMDGWSGAPRADPQLRIGPVVSGCSVVASTSVTRQIKSQHRKVLGLEMETYGVYYACSAALRSKPHFISLKAVCDYADSKKNDNAQRFAAFVSARFCFSFAHEHLLSVEAGSARLPT